MRWSLKSLLVMVTGVALLTMCVGRLPKTGSVAVLTENQESIEMILAENGIKDWSGTTDRGGAFFELHSGFDLWRIEDQLMAEANERGYWIRIDYQALFSIYNSSRERGTGLRGEG